MAMAVSDFEPVPEVGKIDSHVSALSIECRPTPKVIRLVRDWAPHVYLVGFKLLSGAPLPDLLAAAERACFANRADLTVANDWATVREGRHAIHLVRPGHPSETYTEPDAAERLVDRVFAWASDPLSVHGPAPDVRK